jgi:hypothetical protein
LLAVPEAPADRQIDEEYHQGNPEQEPPPRPCCSGRMKVIESFDGSLRRPYFVRRLDGL